ncbi:MAG: type II toxin-antitoxin system VapC family toxin [Solirubrobacteraceae bacterium]
MADRPVLDSDVLIDYLRGAGPGRALLGELRASLGYRATAVSAFELALGRSYARDPAPVLAVLAPPCLSVTRAAGLRAGALLRMLRSEGRGLDVRDAMQAGICLEARLPLVTRNLDHFERVPGLRIFHPEEWSAGLA